MTKEITDLILNISISIVSGISTGLASSYIFLHKYIKRKKPEISISKKISKVLDPIDSKNPNGKKEPRYYFKFINNTAEDIYDIECSLTFHKPIGEIDGHNLKTEDIPLNHGDIIPHVPCDKDNDEYNLHCRRVYTKVNLYRKWSDQSSFLKLTIKSKHSLSGMSHIETQVFRTKDCISHNKFISGNSLDLIK